MDLLIVRSDLRLGGTWEHALSQGQKTGDLKIRRAINRSYLSYQTNNLSTHCLSRDQSLINRSDNLKFLLCNILIHINVLWMEYRLNNVNTKLEDEAESELRQRGSVEVSSVTDWLTSSIFDPPELISMRAESEEGILSLSRDDMNSSQHTALGES